jgi:hypothetical protein
VIVLLVGASLRLLSSLAGGILLTQAPTPTVEHHVRIGDVIIWFAGAGDGQGLLLALAGLGALWWMLSNQMVTDGASTRWNVVAERLCLWSAAVNLLTALSALGLAVGTVVYYWKSAVRWPHFIGTGGFSLSYALVAFTSTYAALALRRQLIRRHDATVVPEDADLSGFAPEPS